MGNVDETTPPATDATVPKPQNVAVPPPQSFIKSMKNTLKETLFPDDPFRPLRNPNLTHRRKAILTLQYLFPILEWGPRYSIQFFKSDLIAGITIASLAIPQGISYAKLANLPPILGLYSSFVPPLIYAVMGSSKDIAIGTVAVGSLLMGSMLTNAVNPQHDPKLFLHLAFTATFFAGVFQAALGIFRLGFIVDFLSHATIVGFMGGAATVVSLQQLKGFLGLDNFTQRTDVFSVMRSVFSQTHMWNWESGVMGFLFLVLIMASRYFSKKKPKFFWVSAMAPLTSVIVASVLVYCTHAHKHGIQVIGQLEKGINPLSLMDLNFDSRYLPTSIKTGIVTGIIALAEGIAAGRSFAMFKNYHIDGNKEMIAFGMMNIAGSCTSSYLTSGPFSRSAVNFNAGCKTAVSNIVMAVAVMMTLLFLTPLFYYTPLVVLSSIIVAAMLGLIDYAAAIHLWYVDKFDFFVCIGAYFGIVFADIEVGLVLAVGLSILRVLLFVARPKTLVLGNIPDSKIYRSIDQYQMAVLVPGILILRIDGPIYFTNSNYLRERISRCVEDEEEKIKAQGETELHHLIVDMSAIGNIDTSGITMIEEVKKVVERKGLKLLLVNPGAEVMKKLSKANFVETTAAYLTVEDAVEACDRVLTATSYSVANV